MDNNSYWTLQDICRKLKRYSFENKMDICNRYSQLLLNKDGNVKFDKTGDVIFPWELECFAMLAMKATPEYRDEKIDGKEFVKIIASIRNADNDLVKQNNNIEFYKRWYSAEALLQFDPQEEIRIKFLGTPFSLIIITNRLT